MVSKKLANPEGSVIPEEHFLYFGQDAKTGKLSAVVPHPVPEGESVVFTSDKAGTPEKFILNYLLEVPENTKPGLYTSTITYSMTTL